MVLFGNALCSDGEVIPHARPVLQVFPEETPVKGIHAGWQSFHPERIDSTDLTMLCDTIPFMADTILEAGPRLTRRQTSGRRSRSQRCGATEDVQVLEASNECTHIQFDADDGYRIQAQANSRGFEIRLHTFGHERNREG